MALVYGLSHEICIAYSDGELVEQVFERILDLRDDHDSGRLCFLVGEMFERWAPESVVLADYERTYQDDENRDLEIAACVEAYRRRQAARLLRDTLGSENDA
jgi:hypothetical protein